MKVIGKYGVGFLVWILLAGMAAMRLTSYGNLNLSVANADTLSYIDEAAGPIFSKDMFIRSRLFTTNLVYNLAKVQNCQLTAISQPALGSEVERAVQPCFTRIAYFQNTLAILAWSVLALVVAKKLHGGFEKLLAVLLITAFGFTPAIADWDSVLGSESLTFSLFAICLALLLQNSFNAIKDGTRNSILLNILTLAALFLWAFTRDANIYAIAVLFAITAASFVIFPHIRKNKNLIIISVVIFIITIVGLQSASASRRWKKPLTNVFAEFILPYPARAEFMMGLGMPDPISAKYPAWFKENAPQAYARFLIAHPGYALTSFTSNLGGIFSENSQPYFFSEQTPARIALTAANDILHPNTHLVFVLDILLIAGLIFSALTRKSDFSAWAWISVWLFSSASVMIVINFFANSIGVTRHTMLAVEMFRLMLWIFLILLFDQAGRKDQEFISAESA
ncbi:MAG: hypothetical protein V9E84_06565 [Trichococcus flocculiformis]